MFTFYARTRSLTTWNCCSEMRRWTRRRGTCVISRRARRCCAEARYRRRPRGISDRCSRLIGQLVQRHCPQRLDRRKRDAEERPPRLHRVRALRCPTDHHSSLVSVRPALTRRDRQPDPEQHAPRTTRLQRSLTHHDPRRSLLLHDTARPSSTPGVRFPLYEVLNPRGGRPRLSAQGFSSVSHFVEIHVS